MEHQHISLIPQPVSPRLPHRHWRWVASLSNRHQSHDQMDVDPDPLENRAISWTEDYELGYPEKIKKNYTNLKGLTKSNLLKKSIIKPINWSAGWHSQNLWYLCESYNKFCGKSHLTWILEWKLRMIIF